MKRLPSTAVRLAAALVVAVVAAAVLIAMDDAPKRAVAYFDRAVNLYVDDEVRVLGVQVGHVTAISPAGTRMRVDLEYDPEVEIPADAMAAIVSPTLVTGRFVQLAPAYGGGAVLADGAVIPRERTVVPVEWDEVKRQVATLAEALGPKGANADGALSRLLQNTAANLDGRGESLGQTIRGISEAMTTLSDGRDDLFATVRNLQVFTSALAQSDAQVAEFTTRLSTVSEILDVNREELSEALRTLGAASQDVQAFVRDHRVPLDTTLDELVQITDSLAAQQDALALALHTGPTALANLYNIYEPGNGSLSGRLAMANFGDPASYVCGAAVAVTSDNTQQEQTCAQALAPLLDLLAMDNPPVAVNPIERNGPAEGVPGTDPSADTPPDGTSPGGLQDLLAPGGPR